MKFTIEVDTENITKKHLELVGFHFNPSGMDEVAQTKATIAYLMDFVHDNGPDSVDSMWKAVDYLELSSMFMVKAITTGK